MKCAKVKSVEFMDKNTKYKWEFLRRNKKYQSQYNTYEYILKDSDDDLTEWFYLEVCREFNINYLIDYNDKKCPTDMFEFQKVSLHKLGPYSLRDFKKSEVDITIAHEFCTSIPGRFAYLNDDAKKLITLTFDTSEKISPVMFLSMCNEMKRHFEFVDVKKLPKKYNLEKDLEVLFVVYDENEKKKSLMSIYKTLKRNNLYRWTDDEDDQIKPQILRLKKRAKKLVEEAINLKFSP